MARNCSRSKRKISDRQLLRHQQLADRRECDRVRNSNGLSSVRKVQTSVYDEQWATPIISGHASFGVSVSRGGGGEGGGGCPLFGLVLSLPPQPSDKQQPTHALSAPSRPNLAT